MRWREMSKINSLRIIGQPRYRSSVISFALAGVHPHDVGTILDHGRHLLCAPGITAPPGRPWKRFRRAGDRFVHSFAIYNDRDRRGHARRRFCNKVREVFRL